MATPTASPPCYGAWPARGRGGQLTIGFGEDEKRQRQADIASWRTRLAQLDRDLATEPARIRELQEVQARRVEPLGLVYLWLGTG